MGDKQEYVFEEDAVYEAFNDTMMGARLAENDVSVEEFTAYLNETFDQDARRCIANLKDDKSVDIENGEVRMFRPVPFEEWKERVEYDP